MSFRRTNSAPQKTAASASISHQPPVAGGVGVIAEQEPPMIHKVRVLLEAGRAEQAFSLLKPVTSDPALKNARGVCLLRMGQPELAIRVFREICLTPGGILFRADVPEVFKTNYAMALMLNGNVSGGVSILNEIGDSGHSQVQALRAAVRQWEFQLPLFQRLLWWLGGNLSRPIDLGAAPGELQ